MASRIATALLSVGVIAGAARSTHVAAPPVRAHAAGPVVVNSLAGRPVLRAAELAPGDATSGTVRLTNRSRRRVALRLSIAVADRVAPGGARLSGRLRLTVLDVSGRRARTLYAGSLGGFRARNLGSIAARRSRRFRFLVALPSGAGDDAYQRESVATTLRWLTE